MMMVATASAKRPDQMVLGLLEEGGLAEYGVPTRLESSSNTNIDIVEEGEKPPLEEGEKPPLEEGEKPPLLPLFAEEPHEEPISSNTSYCSSSSHSGASTGPLMNNRYSGSNNPMNDSYYSVLTYFQTDCRHHHPPTEVTPLFWGGHIQMVQEEQGRWKDGLCDCFRFGLFHPSVWNALCCPTILMGQILTRLDLTWLASSCSEQRTVSSTSSDSLLLLQGRSRSLSDLTMERSNQFFRLSTAREGTPSHHHPNQNHRFTIFSSSSTNVIDEKPISYSRQGITAFTRILVLTGTFWVLLILLAPPLPKFVHDPETGKLLRIQLGDDNAVVTGLQWVLFDALIVASFLYIVGVLTRLRHQVRKRDDIPASTHQEDFCISLWCSCCSLSQMARQTCDYEDEGQEAFCCSPTGLGSDSMLSSFTSPSLSAHPTSSSKFLRSSRRPRQDGGTTTNLSLGKDYCLPSHGVHPDAVPQSNQHVNHSF